MTALISHLMSLKHKCESFIIQSSTGIFSIKRLQQSLNFKVLQDLIARCQGPVVQSIVNLTSSLRVQLVKGLLHCFSTCIEITGTNWYWCNLKNVENCKEKSQRV